MMHVENTEQGLGFAWWGFKSLISTVCGFFPGGSLIFSSIDSALDSLGYKGEVGYVPTASEQPILDAFSKTFGQFMAVLEDEFNAALKLSSFDKQLVAINTVVSKMCYVNKHYANLPTAGLSINAIYVRGDLIRRITDTYIEVIIKDTFIANGVAIQSYSANVTLKNVSFSPLPIAVNSLPFACSQFGKNITNSQPTIGGDDFLPINTNTGGNPPKGFPGTNTGVVTPIILPASPIINTGAVTPGHDPVKPHPMDPMNPTADLPETKPDNTWLKIIGLGLAGWGLSKALSKKKK